MITYEPDEVHFSVFSSNIKSNKLGRSVILRFAAISNENVKASFTRVLGNTTGSHLTHSKKNPYGLLEEVIVNKQDIKEILQNNQIDLMKIDAEGHEGEIIERIPLEQWSVTDAIVEVGTPENAERLYRFFQKTCVKLFSQKMGWKPVLQLSDMPTSHREGSLFISMKNEMPCGENH